MKKGRRPTALGCFIFAGGFTVGVRKHFEVLGHFEDGNYGVETAQHNIPELRGRVWTDRSAWPVKQFKGKVDFLYSNPPCAPWSRASEGRATPWNEDPRIDWIRRDAALLESVAPKVWAWESVQQAWTKGRELVETVARRGMELGYSATVLLLNGADCGVPQVRKRFFLVLHRAPIDWQPTGVKEWTTVGDAIIGRKFKTQTVTAMGDSLMRVLKKMRKGDTDFQDVFDREFGGRKPRSEHIVNGRPSISGRPSFMNRRLSADKPSLVLTGGVKLVHPTERRFISVEESAALCGYPPDFKFIGPNSKQYAQVAQAVMPPVAEYLARNVAKSLGGKPIRKPYFEKVTVLPDRIDREVLTLMGGRMSLAIPDRSDPPFDKAVLRKTAPFYKAVLRKTIPRKLGSGFRIRQMLVADKFSTEQILATIHKEFPGSKAKASDVYWNKRKLQQQGGVP